MSIPSIFRCPQITFFENDLWFCSNRLGYFCVSKVTYNWLWWETRSHPLGPKTMKMTDLGIFPKWDRKVICPDWSRIIRPTCWATLSLNLTIKIAPQTPTDPKSIIFPDFLRFSLGSKTGPIRLGLGSIWCPQELSRGSILINWRHRTAECQSCMNFGFRLDNPRKSVNNPDLGSGGNFYFKLLMKEYPKSSVEFVQGLRPLFHPLYFLAVAIWGGARCLHFGIGGLFWPLGSTPGYHFGTLGLPWRGPWELQNAFEVVIHSNLFDCGVILAPARLIFLFSEGCNFAFSLRSFPVYFLSMS